MPPIQIRSPANMVDRISTLSDELLCHILSFLPTQQAVATSVLSKRWKPLWTSVPVLDYDDEIYIRNNKPSFCFERFVHATILARDPQQPITSFRLKYGVSGDVANVSQHRHLNSDVNVWLNTAVKRGIQYLDIEMFPLNYISLSRCIFSCKTLVHLKLRGLFLNASSSVELPSLKSLHLVQVEFVEPQNLLELLYGCPILQDFKTNDIYYYEEAYFSEEGFKILPKLVTADLLFVGVISINILLKAICNVEFLSIKQYQVDDAVPEFPHLRHLALSMNIHNWNWVLLMLKNCPKLQSLTFDLRQSEDVEDDALSNYSHFVVPFAVPECLTSHFTKCHLKYYSGTESDLQFAKYIMENSTSLLSMTVHSVSSNPWKQLEELKDLALCPRRSASCQLSFSFE